MLVPELGGVVVVPELGVVEPELGAVVVFPVGGLLVVVVPELGVVVPELAGLGAVEVPELDVVFPEVGALVELLNSDFNATDTVVRDVPKDATCPARLETSKFREVRVLVAVVSAREISVLTAAKSAAC